MVVLLLRKCAGRKCVKRLIILVKTLWRSNLALCVANICLSIVLYKLLTKKSYLRSENERQNVENIVYDETLSFNESVKAAMTIFDFMRDQKVGKKMPKPLDYTSRSIADVWCWSSPSKPPNVTFSNIYWQIVTEAYPAEIYLYSAYYDNRPSEIYPHAYGLTHVLAMVRRGLRGKLYCHIWLENSAAPLVVEAFFREIWQRGWDPRNRFYCPWLISCPISKDRVPSKVSIKLTAPCKSASNLLDIKNYKNPSKESTSGKIVVCVKGMDFVEDNSLRLVEWIELQFLLGADKIVLYTYWVHPRTERVLQYYVDKGKLLQIRLTLPGRAPNSPYQRSRFIWRNRQQKRRNEIVPYNDCLYRHLYTHQYLLIVDTDEAVVPQTPLNHWRDLLAKVNTRNYYTAFSIRNAFLFDNFTTSSNPRVPPYMHMLRHEARARKLSEPGNYGKSFVYIANAASVFNHFPLHKQRRDAGRTMYVSADLALKLHFKAVCPIESRDECPDLYRHTETEKSLRRFADSLITNVRKTVDLLKLLDT